MEIDKVFQAWKDTHPDLWKRTEEIAKIIDPYAFSDAIIHPADSAALHKTRQRYQQSIAISKAQDVLKHMGVNTDTDWLLIIDHMSKAA